MPTMLRHKVTGEVWPYNPNLALHADVESFVQIDPQFQAAAADDRTIGDLQAAAAAPKVEAAAAPKPKAKAKTAKAVAPPAPAVDPLAGLDDLELPDYDAE